MLPMTLSLHCATPVDTETGECSETKRMGCPPQKQEYQVEASLGNRVTSCLKKTKTKATDKKEFPRVISHAPTSSSIPGSPTASEVCSVLAQSCLCSSANLSPPNCPKDG